MKACSQPEVVKVFVFEIFVKHVFALHEKFKWPKQSIYFKKLLAVPIYSYWYLFGMYQVINRCI